MVVFTCLNLIGILTIIDVRQVEALMSGMDHKKYINTFINNLVSAEAPLLHVVEACPKAQAGNGSWQLVLP